MSDSNSKEKKKRPELNKKLLCFTIQKPLYSYEKSKLNLENKLSEWTSH